MHILFISILLYAIYPLAVFPQCIPCDKHTTSKTTRYHVAVDYRDANGTRVMRISAQDNRFDRDDLLELACRLHRDFDGESKLFIYIFDNKSAAKKYVSPSDRHKPADWKSYAKSFRAFYSWEAGSSHWIVWDFDPLVESSQQERSKHSTIDLCLN